MTRRAPSADHRPRRRTPLLLLGVCALLLTTLGIAPAGADIDGSDFPPRSDVKAALDGTGQWSSYTDRIERTIGGRPRGCRSDRQMLAYDRARERTYYGHERGVRRSINADVVVAVFHYASASAARDALARNASYPRRCPRVTEWTCTDCDGISTTRRDRVAARRIGQQSVTWTYRRAENLKGAGYCVVARKGSVVVRVEVGRMRDPYPRFVYPPLLKKSTALGIARMALRSAT